MRIRSLRHVLEVVNAMIRPLDITVMGSSALLAADPALGEAGQPLETSLDADLLIEPCDEKTAALVHEAVGEGSLFHREYGVYVDVLKRDIEATLPPGWRGRRVALPEAANVRCLDVYDLAVAKVALGRAKDMDLLHALVRKGVVDVAKLRVRYQETPMDEATMFQAGRNLTALSKEAGKT